MNTFTLLDDFSIEISSKEDYLNFLRTLAVWKAKILGAFPSVDLEKEVDELCYFIWKDITRQLTQSKNTDKKLVEFIKSLKTVKVGVQLIH